MDWKKVVQAFDDEWDNHRRTAEMATDVKERERHRALADIAFMLRDCLFRGLTARHQASGREGQEDDHRADQAARRTLMTPEQKLLHIVKSAHGDNLERALVAFRGLSAKAMDSEYGQSGQTCRQILAEYENERAEYLAAKKLLLELLESARN